jgi:uncharacterized protein with LGFP repeats
MLFTAIAATVITVFYTVDTGLGPRTDHRERPAQAAGTRFALRPLIGLGGGVTVREITQATAFSMVALTGANLTGTAARVRAKHPDGSWGRWYSAEVLESDGDGSPGVVHGTDPVFVGETTTVQISVSRPVDAPVTVSSDKPPGATAPHKPAPLPDLGYLPATIGQPLAQDISAILISPPQAPADTQWTPPTAVIAAGRPPNIISRSQWGAAASARCAKPRYAKRIRAAVVHHTAQGNDYAPQDSARIVRSVYDYHTKLLGWCDIAYHALVDRYGQVFEGRSGGLGNAVEGWHTGGFNRETWGVAMIGDFDDIPPTPIQLRAVGRLLGWRLGLDHVDPKGKVTLTSAGGSNTHFPAGAAPTLPTIFSHRDVGKTVCPGNAGYALLGEIRDTAARFNDPPSPADLAASLQGGAIYARWQRMGGENSALGVLTSPEATAAGSARYATFGKGAMYWSPETDAEPVTGAIYDAWASLGYERGALGLPTSAEFAEPQWVKQNFQHGTLNFDRLSGRVTRVIDGVAQELPPPPPGGPPVQLERFSRPVG